MKTKLILIGLIAITAFSCSKKDEGTPQPTVSPYAPKPDAKPLSKAEATSKVSSGANSMSSQISAMENSQSVNAMQSLASVNNATAVVDLPGMRVSPGSSIIQSILKSFKLSSVKLNSKGARIDEPLASNKGIYNYNPATEELVEAGVSDKIVINFPDSVNKAMGLSGKNNCTLTISDFETTIITKATKKDTLPTKVNMTLSVDNVEQMAVSFLGTYNADGDPTSINASMTLRPFKLTETLATDTKTFINTTALLENIVNPQRIFGYDIKVTSADINNSDFDTYSGFVFVDDIAVEGNFNAKAIREAESVLNPGEELSEAVINANVKVKVKSYSTGDILATVKYKAVDKNFYAVYSDNTEELLETFLAPLKNNAPSLDGFLGGSAEEPAPAPVDPNL